MNRTKDSQNVRTAAAELQSGRSGSPFGDFGRDTRNSFSLRPREGEEQLVVTLAIFAQQLPSSA
jgi:hypothetical protein